MTLEQSKILAIAAINIVNDDIDGAKHITISQIKSDTKKFEIVDKNEIIKLSKTAMEKYPNEKK